MAESLIFNLFQPAHNSGYMVPLRFTQIFAPLRSAKTSYSRGTLDEKPRQTFWWKI